MADVALSHYSAKPWALDPARTYVQSTREPKPRGLWLSVDGEQDWPTWCRSEDWGVASLAHRTALRLVGGHRVLTLDTPAALAHFTDVYGRPTTPEFLYIDWPRVAASWDGLLIAPYQWSMRYDPHVPWYYGWDCASACVWNLGALEVLEPVDEGAGPLA